MTARWQSWHAAFEEAGKLGAGDPAYDKTAHITVSADDYAAALGDHGGLPFDVQQEACRTGVLSLYDARGRRVVLSREGARREGMDPALRAALDARPVHPPTDPLPHESGVKTTDWPGPVAPMDPDTGKATFTKALAALKPKGKKK